MDILSKYQSDQSSSSDEDSKPGGGHASSPPHPSQSMDCVIQPPVKLDAGLSTQDDNTSSCPPAVTGACEASERNNTSSMNAPSMVTEGSARSRRRISRAQSDDPTLPRELALELARQGGPPVSFVDVDARGSAAARNLVTDADRAAAASSAAFRQRMQASSVSRAQRRTHHISSLAAGAVASVAAQSVVADGSVQKRKRNRKR